MSELVNPSAPLPEGVWIYDTAPNPYTGISGLRWLPTQTDGSDQQSPIAKKKRKRIGLVKLREVEQ